jgi:hypothetical protein
MSSLPSSPRFSYDELKFSFYDHNDSALGQNDDLPKYVQLIPKQKGYIKNKTQLYLCTAFATLGTVYLIIGLSNKLFSGPSSEGHTGIITNYPSISRGCFMSAGALSSLNSIMSLKQAFHPKHQDVASKLMIISIVAMIALQTTPIILLIV